MSVLIKGISMPKESWDCPCHDGETGWCKVTGSSCEPIPKDCPLVEVPTPHETERRMMNDLISKQYVIDVLIRWYGSKPSDLSAFEDMLDDLPSAQPETCEGCKHLGRWEFEVEHGYNSPCTVCRRRARDRYAR